MYQQKKRDTATKFYVKITTNSVTYQVEISVYDGRHIVQRGQTGCQFDKYPPNHTDHCKTFRLLTGGLKKPPKSQTSRTTEVTSGSTD